MNRNTVIALIAAAVAAVAALVYFSSHNGQATGTTPAPAAVEAAPVDHTPAAPDMAVGDSCSVDCGGTPAAITCAEGEKPVCDCAATPRTQCLPPAAKP